MEYYSFFKKNGIVICDFMDETGGCDTKCNKPSTKRYILHEIIFMYNLKKLNS